MSEESEPPILRGEGGKFLPGTRGGPGRQRKRPLREVCGWDEEAALWATHYELAKTDAAAREFLLRHLAGVPQQAAPDLPPIAWQPVASLEDLLGCVNAALGAHAAGEIDGAGLGYLTDLILKLARVFEAVDLAPRLRRIEEQLAAQAAMAGAA